MARYPSQLVTGPDLFFGNFRIKDRWTDNGGYLTCFIDHGAI